VTREENAYAWCVSAWLFLSLALPEWKLGLGLLGPSPGSSTQGINLYFVELGVLPLFAWALFRAKSPVWVWILGGVFFLLMALAFFSGLAHGSAPRDALAEIRPLLFAVDVFVLAALLPSARAWALGAFFYGWLAWAGATLLLFVVEPSAATNFNIVPVPVPALGHSLHGFWLCAVLGISLPLLRGWRSVPVWLLVLLAWCLVWLSYVRALWIAWPLAALLASLWLWWRKDFSQARGFLTFQAAVMALSLAGLLLLQSQFAPDGAFMLKFRLYRTLQAAHLVPALPEKLALQGHESVLLKNIALRGALFRGLNDPAQAPTALESNHADPSLADRALMIREALRAFKEAPLLGKGLGGLFHYEVYPGQARSVRDPHNGYAWWLAKSGALGASLALGLLLWGFAVWRKVPAAAEIQAAQLAVFGSFLMLEFFQVGLLNADTGLALAAALVLFKDPS
jgi:hypothetical protein